MRPRTGARSRRRIRVTIGGAAAFTQSLAVGGFSAEVMRVPPRGSPVQGTMYLGEKDFDYIGDVVWVKPGDPRINLRGRVGVRFTQLNAEARRLIEAALFTPAR
jgi:PilZ domain